MADDCATALIPTITYGALTDYQRLGILDLIDQDQYQRMKESGGIALSLPVDGIPISATQSFDDFAERRSREFRRYQYDYSRDVSVSYFSSSLGPESRAAYEACLARQSGLYQYVKSVNADEAGVRIGYVPPVGDRSSIEANAHDFENVTNKVDIDHTIRYHKWASTVQHDILVRPIDTAHTASFEVTRGEQTVSVIVPPLKQSAPPPISLVDAAYQGHPVNIVLNRGIGTLIAGYVYRAQYNNITNCWTVTGFNAGAAHGVGTWTYCNAPHNKGSVSMWGAVLTFNDNGDVFGSGQCVGVIRLSS